MGRTRENKTKAVTNQIIKPKKKPIKNIWKFKVGDSAIYIGELYPSYHLKMVYINERYKGKIRQYYKLKDTDINGVEIGDVTGDCLQEIIKKEEGCE